MRALHWSIGHIFSWSLDMKGWMMSHRRQFVLLCSNIDGLRQIGLLRQQPDLPPLYLSVNHDIHTVRSDMHVVCSSTFPKVVWRKKLRSLDTSNILTFCQIFEVTSRVRQKVVDHRSLTIEKCSVQEKKSRWRQKVVYDRVVDDRIYCSYHGSLKRKKFLNLRK